MNSPSESDARPGLPLLNAAEARTLGCLIEKEATTPETYPLTVNAAHMAANQKTARDPVMALDPGSVHHALRELERHGFAKQVFSSRAERYEHRTGARLGLPQQQVALLGLLLLRGPQTVHELLARSERLAKFADADDAQHHLERLCGREPALAQQLPRAPGQREERYVHLLSGAIDVATHAEAPPSATRTPRAGNEWEARLAALETEVAALRDTVARLQGAGD